MGLPERLEPAPPFRGAGGFGDGGLRVTGGFVGLRGIAMARGGVWNSFAIAGNGSQLQNRGVVVSYFNYYLFYIQIGVCCDWVSNAKESQRFCTR
jgi:hypothetical protein